MMGSCNHVSPPAICCFHSNKIIALSSLFISFLNDFWTRTRRKITILDCMSHFYCYLMQGLLCPKLINNQLLFHHQQTKSHDFESSLQDVEHGIDLFTNYNTKTIFALGMISVDKAYRQLDLATTLVRLSFDLARPITPVLSNVLRLVKTLPKSRQKRTGDDSKFRNFTMISH